MQRRDLIKVTAGAVVAVKVASSQEHRFFTADEFRMVDELTEMIIPADEKSGGAKAAKVAEFIDARLAEGFYPAGTESERDQWRAGLRSIDEISKQMHGVAFLEAGAEQRTAVLTRVAANETAPREPEDHFFLAMKRFTVKGYYTSKIGIHDDLDYRGNVYQSDEYAGELP
jgi:gluconate 2-dehydrogenase gamma chain